MKEKDRIVRAVVRKIDQRIESKEYFVKLIKDHFLEDDQKMLLANFQSQIRDLEDLKKEISKIK